MHKIKYIGWISNLQGVLFFHLFDAYGFRLDKTIGEIFFINNYDYINHKNFIFWHGILDFTDKIENEQYFHCCFIASSRKINNQKVLNGKFFILEKISCLKDLYKYVVQENVNYNVYVELIKKEYIIAEFNIVILQNGLIQISLQNNKIYETDEVKSIDYFF